MIHFCDLPDAKRMAFRDAIETAGGLVEGYQGEYIQVAIPDPAGPFFAAMDKAGLELDGTSLCHYPLGTDNPPQHLRHCGRYQGSKGFWLYGRFAPAP